MRQKIGQIYKLVKDDNIHAILAISVTNRIPEKVGLISLPFNYKVNGYNDIEDTGLWSKTTRWNQGDRPSDPNWNTISDKQFRIIIGEYWDYENFIPIEFDEYVKILNS